MKTTSTVLACALLALAGCASDSSKPWSSDAGGSTSTSGTAGTSGSSGSADGMAGSGASTRSTASTDSATGTSGTSGTSGMSAATAGTAAAQAASVGVVQTVDQITRQDAMSMGLASGAAAAGGTMGSPTSKVYRVTLRMDDGTTQTVIAESMPSYKNGDRVRYANGAVQRE